MSGARPRRSATGGRRPAAAACGARPRRRNTAWVGRIPRCPAATPAAAAGVGVGVGRGRRGMAAAVSLAGGGGSECGSAPAQRQVRAERPVPPRGGSAACGRHLPLGPRAGAGGRAAAAGASPSLTGSGKPECACALPAPSCGGVGGASGPHGQGQTAGIIRKRVSSALIYLSARFPLLRLV